MAVSAQPMKSNVLSKYQKNQTLSLESSTDNIAWWSVQAAEQSKARRNSLCYTAKKKSRVRIRSPPVHLHIWERNFADYKIITKRGVWWDDNACIQLIGAWHNSLERMPAVIPSISSVTKQNNIAWFHWSETKSCLVLLQVPKCFVSVQKFNRI